MLRSCRRQRRGIMSPRRSRSRDRGRDGEPGPLEGHCTIRIDEIFFGVQCLVMHMYVHIYRLILL